MTYHPITEIIKNLLVDRKMWFEAFEHEPVRTSEQAAKVRPEYSLHQGAKAMIIRAKRSETDRKFMMLVFPADLKFDMDKTKKLLGAKDIRFATEPEVLEITNGVQPGGVPPFGNLFGLEVIADPSLFENEKIIFNAGDRCFSIAMRSADYKVLVNPQVEHIV
jgi:prolyl-tRNA editing enzyme YbaK/EbsC (Cys-tRNA(Pro) deacylase)